MCRLANHSLFFSSYRNRRAYKEKSINKKKFALVAKVFCGHAYSTDLIGHIRRTNDSEEKIHVDWMNRHNLEHMANSEEKHKTISFQSTDKESMIQ